MSDGWRQWYPNEDSFNLTGLKWIYIQSGSPLKGWFKIGSDWYFARDNYSLESGWITYGNKNYYLNDRGKMLTNYWVSTDGKWYYLDNSGVMQTGWVSSGGKWQMVPDGQ